MGKGKLQVLAYDAADQKQIAQGVLDLVDNQVDQTTGTVKLKAEFPNTDEALWPGQFVNAHLVVETVKNGVTVPSAAVQTGPNGRFAYVVKPDNTVEARPVTVTQTENNVSLRRLGPAGGREGRHGGTVQSCRPAQRSLFPTTRMLLPPLDRRRPVYRRERSPNEHLGALHCAADRHLPAHAGAARGRHRRLQSSSGRGAADGRFPDDYRCRRACPAPTRRPWLHRSRNRSSASSPICRASTRSRRRACSATRRSRFSSTFPATSTARPATSQAAINAAQGSLPKNLPTPPTYRKVNPADHPVLILGLTSPVMPLTQLDQYADLNIAQRISAMSGVGQVLIFGQQKYAPTIMVNPLALAARGIGLDDIASAVTSNSADLPVGTLQGPRQSYQIGTNGQLFSAEDIGRAVVAYRNGAPVRLQDVAQVVAGSESPLQASWVGNERGEMIGIWRQPGANTVQLVDQIKAALPQLQTGIPPSVKVSIVSDRSISIRESFTDVKLTLVAAIVLVVIVIFIFLRNFWATLIPSVTVPLSLVGTFGIMYMLGYSLDNLSLMALTLAVGLVVDDAIVMLENIFRYLEQGYDRVTAALKGAKEIGFTIVSITVSLVAVFIPILFMSGIVGRLFREFGVVVTVAVVLSALIALTLSPMMASLVLENPREARHGRLYQWSERGFKRLIDAYERGLKFTLRHRRVTMTLNLVLIAVSGWMFYTMPKGFFPQEDTGLIFGFTQADQDISFDGMASRAAGGRARSSRRIPTSPPSAPRSAAAAARA